MVRVSVKIKRLLVEEGLITTEEWENARQEGGDILDSRQLLVEEYRRG